MKILIAESGGFSPAAVASLREIAEVRTEDVDKATLMTALHDVDVLWVRLRHTIYDEIWAGAPRLRAVVRATTGLDHIDLEACRARGIDVFLFAASARSSKTSSRQPSTPCC